MQVFPRGVFRLRPFRGRAPSAPSLLMLVGAGCVALAPMLVQPLVRAASPFTAEPVQADQVIALAQPLGYGRWNLVVFEQREPAPPCWRRHADGSVTTYETHLSEATCGRYLSSNAYSLRVAGNDLRHPWRLRIEQQNGQLSLLAIGSQQPQPLLVGSGRVAGARPVQLQLAEGWAFERRSYEGQRLSHLYVANPNPLPVLMAQARSGGRGLMAVAPLPPPPPGTDSRLRSRRTALQPDPLPETTQPRAGGGALAGSRLERLNRLQLGAMPRTPRTTTSQSLPFAADDEDSGVIALQVVPYRP